MMPTWVEELIQATLAFTFIILLFLNLKGCSDVSVLESSVTGGKAFVLMSKEWSCKLTDKQLRVDDLIKQIQDVRKQ